MIKKAFVFLVLLSIFLFNGDSYAKDKNLIVNPSFEELNGDMPTSWYTESYDKTDGVAQFAVIEGEGHDGNKQAAIINTVENDSRFLQKISVKGNTHYKFSGWIKAENIGDAGYGANISIGNHLETSTCIKGTYQAWQYVELYVKVEGQDAEINISLCLGGYSNLSTGTAFFDDIRFEEVSKIPEGAVFAVIRSDSQDNEQAASQESTDNNSARKNGRTLQVLILSTICIVGFALFLIYSDHRRENKKGLSVNDDCKKEEYIYVDDDLEESRDE